MTWVIESYREQMSRGMAYVSDPGPVFVGEAQHLWAVYGLPCAVHDRCVPVRIGDVECAGQLLSSLRPATGIVARQCAGVRAFCDDRVIPQPPTGTTASH